MPKHRAPTERVLVTGGSGFIGSNVAEALVAAGHDVLVADRVAPPGELPYVIVDVRDQQQMAAAFRAFRPEVVFHFAAQADGRLVSADPVSGIQTNVLGTAIALEAASVVGVRRFVLASSIFVYAASTGRAADEDVMFLGEGAGHVHTTNFVAREWLVHDFRARRGLPFTILRMAPVYGPRMWPGLAVRAFLEAARRGGPIVVFGDGQDRRAFLHVCDLTAACIAVLADEAE